MQKPALIIITAATGLFQGCIDFSPPKPIEIITPSSITVETRIPPDNFLIEIKDDHSVWYQVNTADSSYKPVPVSEPVTAHLQKAIADYEKNHADEIKIYLLKAGSDSCFDKFEQVIEAMKQNNVYKYNLIIPEKYDTAITDSINSKSKKALKKKRV